MSSDSSTPAEKVEMYCPVCDASYPADAAHCPNDGAKLVRIIDRKDELVGRVLDERFTIKDKLGSGGMGSVYRALQHSVGREVAIKVIDPRLAGHKDITKRFLREAQLSSRLSQPNTVTVLDFGQTQDGLLYLVMELLAGKSLDALLEQERILSEARAVRIAIQICDALDAAQSLKIVHRDLKPGNVVILDEPPGRDMTKVLDFGIAKSLAGSDSGITTVTRSDMILGTPSYIAPEAIKGGTVDQRADLYALGVMLYEMVSGHLPFSAKTVNAMLACHTAEAPAPLPETVSPGLAAIIMKLLSKAAEDRFASAAQTREALAATGLVTIGELGRISVARRSDAEVSTDPALLSTTPGPFARPDTPAPASSHVFARPATPEPTYDAAVPGHRKAPVVWVAGGVVALVLLGVVGLMIRDRNPPPAGPAQPALPAPPNTAAAAPAALPADASATPTVDSVRLSIDSIPRGARVLLRRRGQKDELLCAKTPCLDLQRPKEAVYAELVFELEGFDPEVVSEIDLLQPVSTTARLRQTTTPKPPRRPTKPNKPPTGTSAPPPTSAPDGEEFLSPERFVRPRRR